MMSALFQTPCGALLALLLTTLATPTFAAEVKLPAELPPYGQDKPLPVPQITQRTLANGLQVWVVPRQSLPRVDFVLAVRGAGFAADAPTQPGFASLLASVLTEGTHQHDSRAIAETAQGLGGALSAASSHDGITLTANALPSQAGTMLGLLAEVARGPAFADKEVALAKANAQQSLKANEATPRFRAERAVGHAVFGAHAYSRTQPTAESIQATTPDALRAAHAQRFHPSHSLLVISGRIHPAAALKLVERSFGDWKAGDAAPEPTTAAPVSAPAVRLLLDRPGSVQATLRLARPGSAANVADEVPLRLTSTVLGGGFSSRVNLNLREDKGYTYGANAGNRSYREGGAIVGGADVRNEVAAASLREFLAEYRRIGTDLVGEQELADTKRYVAGGYLLSTQMQGALARQLASNWLVGLPPEFLGRYVPLVQQVSAEQVRAMGRKYFNPDEQSLIVVGDKAVLGEQLKAVGEFATPGR